MQLDIRDNNTVEMYLTLRDLTALIRQLNESGKVAVEEKREFVYLKVFQRKEGVHVMTGTCEMEV